MLKNIFSKGVLFILNLTILFLQFFSLLLSITVVIAYIKNKYINKNTVLTEFSFFFLLLKQTYQDLSFQLKKKKKNQRTCLRWSSVL